MLLTLNTLALNMVSVVHNALKIFESMQRQLLGPDHIRAQVPSSLPSLPPLPELSLSPSLSLQSPLASEELNVSEYTHRILFGGRTAESFSPPSPLRCQDYNFKVRGERERERLTKYGHRTKLFF